MNRLTVSAMERRDIPALKSIWKEAFGDPEELIDGFFALLPGAGYGLVLRDGEDAVAMSYVLEGLRAEGKACSYIYAVATNPEYRGRGGGALLMRACGETARERGCEVLCTSPAEPSLYGWYGKVLGMEPASYSVNYRVDGLTDENTAEPRLISPGEYNLLREQYLCGTPHMSFPDGYVAMEEMVCRVCGGALIAAGSGAAACYPEDGELKIRELLCPEGEFRGFIAAAAKKFSCSSATVQGRSLTEPHIAAAPASSLPGGLWWGLALD